MAQRIVLGGTALVFALVGLSPLAMMGLDALDGTYYADLFSNPRTWTLLGHSLSLALVTGILSVAIGMPLGVLLCKTDLPLRRTLAAFFAVPLVLPPYVVAVAWYDLAGQSIEGLSGCALVLTSTFMPVVLILTMAFLRMVDPRLEEAARLSAGWARTLLGITLPLALPGIVLGGLLVFLLAFGEFGVPAFLRYDVFPVESFTQFSAFYDYGRATAAALPLALVALFVLTLERIFLRERTWLLRPAAGESEGTRIRLGRTRPWAAAGATLFALLWVLLPLAGLLASSLEPGAYRDSWAKAGESLVRSLLYGSLGASLLTAFGFLIGYLVEKRSLPLWRTVDSLTLVLFALPSTVISIGLVRLWNRPETALVYATPAIILVGYLIQYTAICQRITVSTLAQIPPSMEQAAAVCGARWLRRLVGITLPLAGRGVAAAWLVAFLFCLRDVGLTLMVYPPGYDTLPVRTFTLMANGAPSLIAALCVLMVGTALVPLAVLAILPRGRAG